MCPVSAYATNMSSSFTVIADDLVFDALPFGWDQKGLRGAVERFSTTKYLLFDKNKKHRSTVEYNGKLDSVCIDKDPIHFETETQLFSPHKFTLNGKEYQIVEKVTGVLTIHRDGKLVAKGKCTSKSVIIKEYPEELRPILPEIATGFLIKMVIWSLFL